MAEPGISYTYHKYINDKTDEIQLNVGSKGANPDVHAKLGTPVANDISVYLETVKADLGSKGINPDVHTKLGTPAAQDISVYLETVKADLGSKGANPDMHTKIGTPLAQDVSVYLETLKADLGSKGAGDDVHGEIDAIKGASWTGVENLFAIYEKVKAVAGAIRNTFFSTKSGVATLYSVAPGTWVTIFSSGALTKDVKMTGIKITNAGTIINTRYRICIDGETDGDKAFPYNPYNDIDSGVLKEFDVEPVICESTSVYYIQVSSADAGDGVNDKATLTELDIIEL